MIRLRRIIKNTVISLLGQGVSMISSILLSFAYGHFLGVFAFGELYFAITFVSLIGIFINGFSTQIVRDVARKPDSASLYFSNVLLIKLGFWFVMYFTMLLISWRLGYSLEVCILIAICGFDLLCNAVVNTFVAIQYALERTMVPVIGGILERGLTTLLGILLLRAGAGVQTMAVILVGGSLVNTIWQAICYYRLVGASFVIDPKLIGKLIRADLPFLISSVLIVGYTSIDTVLLSLLTNSTVVGLYGAVARLTDAVSSLPSIVMMVVMYPILSKLADTSDDELKLSLEKCMNFMLFCGMPIATLLIVAAPNIIDLLYGSGFTGAIPALQAFAPFALFLYINFAFITVVFSKKMDRIILITNGAALIFNLGFNLIFIPLFQQVGSSIVTSLTEVLLFCIYIFIIPRNLLPLRSLKVAFKALIASLLMAIVILSLHTLHIFILLPIAMLVYFGASLLIGTIPREDYQAILNAIRKKKVQQSQSANDTSENLVPIFDLPTMLMPAYNKVSLLDIELAITGKLPMIRLPLAPQRTGLASNSLGKGEAPSYAPPVTPAPAYFAYDTDRLADIEMMTTATLPATHLQTRLGETKTVRSSAVSANTNVISVGAARTDNSDGKKHSGNNGGWNR